jgi:hypothetical protein
MASDRGRHSRRKAAFLVAFLAPAPSTVGDAAAIPWAYRFCDPFKMRDNRSPSKWMAMVTMMPPLRRRMQQL